MSFTVEIAEVTIRLYGSLVRKGEDTTRSIETSEPMSLPSIISHLGVPVRSVRLAMVNHRAVSSGVIVYPGDRVALFPAEYPFFADWKDYWPEPE
jgi:hypothetical protein